jgi:ATP-dependent Lon protease
VLFVLLDAQAQVDVPVSTLIAAVSAVFSVMLSVIVWLFKHGFDAEKRLMLVVIEDAKATAKTASDKLTEQIELRHKQEILITQLQGKVAGFQASLDQLADKDSAQDQILTKLKERLDKGQRTFSQQMQPIQREEPPSDPPDPPRIARRSSRTNE